MWGLEIIIQEIVSNVQATLDRDSAWTPEMIRQVAAASDQLNRERNAHDQRATEERSVTGVYEMLRRG
jgi:hypothetical protein